MSSDPTLRPEKLPDDADRRDPARLRALLALERVQRLYLPYVALQMLAQADVIVSVLPSTRETRHLFTADRFNHCKPGAIFFNVGRGNAVHEGDLLAALLQGGRTSLTVASVATLLALAGQGFIPDTGVDVQREGMRR